MSFLFCKETPILGGAKVPMMRRSTIKALETRRDEGITERKQQSKMRPLGASNPHNNNKDKHRDDSGGKYQSGLMSFFNINTLPYRAVNESSVWSIVQTNEGMNSYFIKVPERME